MSRETQSANDPRWFAEESERQFAAPWDAGDVEFCERCGLTHEADVECE